MKLICYRKIGTMRTVVPIFLIIQILKFESISSLSFKNSSQSRRISEAKCDEYFEKSKNSMLTNSLSLIHSTESIQIDPCLFSQGIIIGGENAKAGEFPHMAAIGYRNLNNVVNFWCGGSLISERYILSAAHCRKSGGITPSIVRLGDLNLIIKEENLPERDVPIETFTSHEKFDPNESKNDIAVIKIVEAVTFSKYIRPACLEIIPDMSKKAIATGWGLIEALTTRTSDIMQKVELNIINDNECRRIYNNTNSDGTILCAGEVKGGKDTCQGDSGGPLQVFLGKDKCIFSIIGITSYGNTLCGLENSFGVYTKVSAYLDWIEEKVWGPES